MKLYQRPLLLILCFFAAISAKALTASFTTSPSPAAGCAPLTVNFTNTSTGATSYDWDFGNSTPISHVTNPGTTYYGQGTYTVTLTAHNGSATATATMVVTVYPLPTVSFTANDTTVCPGTTVTFSSSSVGGTPGPMTYAWSFGDGGSGSGSNPTHTYYPPAGYYSVVLSVTNSQGCNASLTKPNYIQVLNPPVPSFTATSWYICTLPGSTTFTSTSTGTGPLSYYWQFGNGNTSTSPTPPPQSYTPPPGNKMITLRVTDANGCSDSTTAYITAGGPTASFTSPAAGCLNSQITFLNTSTNHGSHTWDFGDFSTSTDSTGTHKYTFPGTYTVTLTIGTGICSSTVSHVITIQPSPALGVTFSPVHPCPPPQAITMSGSVVAGSTVSWIFEDGSTASGNPVSHTFFKRGYEYVKMIVTSPLGCVDTLAAVDTIHDIQVSLGLYPSAGCTPLNVAFTSNVVSFTPDTTAGGHPYAYGIASYTWTFGDGSPSVTGPATFAYLYSGRQLSRYAYGCHKQWVRDHAPRHGTCRHSSGSFGCSKPYASLH